MPVSTARTASYKGHSYRLLFIGDTKFGRRAKLQFLDGTKEFWVAASLVSETAAGSSGFRRGARTAPRVSHGCWECPSCGEENPESSSSCWECGCGRR